MKQLGLWLSAALTIFMNGLLHGSVAGGSAALALLKAGASPNVALGSGLGVAASNGVKRVLVWSDPNPIPNPFPGWVTPSADPSSSLIPAAGGHAPGATPPAGTPAA